MNGRLSVDDSAVLTDNGILQANNIVSELQKYKIDSVLSSPLPRAIQTISPYCETADQEIKLIPELAEGHLMLKEGVCPEQPEYVERQGIGKVPIKAESDGQFYCRTLKAIQIILSQSADCTLVISHGHIIRELLNQFFELKKRIRFPHGNCHATSIVMGENIMVNFINKNFAL